jgi:trehalose-phosphatase
MLDYDGTLAPFHARRDMSHPSPRSLDLLKKITGDRNASVALVSGRPVCEIERLIGSLPATIVGEHGWETLTPGGDVVRWCLPRGVQEALDRAHRAAVRGGWESRLERKRSSLVLHTRNLPPGHARVIEGACASLWEPLSIQYRLGLDRINGGLELRARGRDKGTAVLSLLSREPPGTLGVFVGDDVSDEDAFRAVRDFGFGVRVGTDDRPSLAAASLPSCEAVVDFLDAWQSVLNGAGPPQGRKRGGPPTRGTTFAEEE